jgi:hypothetical protein
MRSAKISLVALMISATVAPACADDASPVVPDRRDARADGHSSDSVTSAADVTSATDANCPGKRTDTLIYGDNFGSLRFAAELLAVETCSSEFCFAGATVGMFRIVALIDDCQRFDHGGALTVGDEVPLSLGDSALGMQLKVGDKAEVACVVEPGCADGCGTFPSNQTGPCFAFEYGCRTRCHDPLLAPPTP